MKPILSWSPGDAVVLRGIWRNKIWWACPALVVRDAPDLLAFYWRAGAGCKAFSERPAPQDLLSNKLELVDRPWVGTDALMSAVLGAAHALYAMWETWQARLRCWYIDLQEPLRRARLGFDTMDHPHQGVFKMNRPVIPFALADPPEEAAGDHLEVEFAWGTKIPMRDGVRLNATLYRPSAGEPVPVISR
jgi:hypothetical protein